MAVLLRGTVWWVDCKYKGLRHREGVGTDKAQALKREAEVLLCLRSGRIPETKEAVGPANLQDAVDLAFKTKWANIRNSPAVTAQCVIMVKFFKNKPVKDMSLRDVQALVVFLRAERKIKDPTIRRYLSALQVVLKVAYNAQMTSNFLNISGIKSEVKDSKGREKIFSSEDREKVLQELYRRNHLYGVFTEALWATGARWGELRALQWSDYKDGQLVFRGATTKSQHQKTLIVGPNLAALLEALPRTSAFIFEGVNRWGYRSAWRHMRTKLKLDKELVSHSIRHTVGTQLVRTVSLAKAQKWLGHRQVATTMKYAHLGTADLADCVSIVDQNCGPSVDQTGSQPTPR